MRMLTSATAAAMVVAGLATVAVGIDRQQSERPAEPLPPRVVFTLPTCDGLPARVNVSNPNEDRFLRVGFNDDVASAVEPGGSVGFELAAGEVQVVVDGRPHGKPYVYLPPSCLQLPRLPCPPGCGVFRQGDQ